MKRIAAIALVIVGIAYPFLVYGWLDQLGPRGLAAPLILLWLARALGARRRQPGAFWLPLAALLFCGVLFWLDSVVLLRWYPVAINLMGLALFGLSLRLGPPVIERIARITEPDLPPSGQRYTRRVTVIWTLFFAANALVSAAFALWASWRWWTLYNGAISYALIGALLLGEWLVRPRHRRAAAP